MKKKWPKIRLKDCFGNCFFKEKNPKIKLKEMDV
jgi:hypothetical protein